MTPQDAGCTLYLKTKTGNVSVQSQTQNSCLLSHALKSSKLARDYIN